MTKIIDKDITSVFTENFVDYSMSVLLKRAIPSALDGLKPVHRRILYAMRQNGLFPSKKYKKSAHTVGFVLGSFHPHGDSSVYDAMVRMAQPWAVNAMLVDGYGNFGSQDGDGAAAYRYTEARLQKFTTDFLLDEIHKDAVPMLPTYDGSDMEPFVLPAKLPLLLINGTSGIGSAHSTDIPPCNPSDVIQATLALLQDPTIGDRDIARRIRIDYPTGGIVCSSVAVENAFTTGRGSVRVRAKVHHEEDKKNGRELIVVDELAYGTNTENVLNSIVQKVKEGTIEGISNIRNESAKGKIRVVVEVKPGHQAGVVENLLYKMTQLQITQKIIMIATSNNDFRQYNAKGLLTDWIEFRRTTLKRIFSFDVQKHLVRMHILEGLLKALADIDKVVAIIRASKGRHEAIERLVAFKHDKSDPGYSPEQAAAILDMRLSKLTGLEKNQLAEEHVQLTATVERLKDLLRDSDELDAFIRSQLEEIASKVKDIFGRKDPWTSIEEIETNIEAEDVVPDEDYLVAITNGGFIKKLKHEINAQKRGGKGTSVGKTREDDFVSRMFIANSKDHLLIFTNTGRVFDVKVWRVAESSMGSVGKPAAAYVSLRENERVQAVLNLSNTQFEDDGSYLMFATQNGQVKKTLLSEFRNILTTGIIAITLKEGDELLGVKFIDGAKAQQNVFMATAGGTGIRFDHSDVRPMGRDTTGVMGIKLREDSGDYVVSFDIVEDEDSYVLTATQDGRSKRTPITEYPVQERGGFGRIATQLQENDLLIKALIVKEEDIMFISSEKMARVPAEEIKIYLRPTYGIKAVSLDEGAYLVDVVRIDADETSEEV
jgi:DNA gyrase subunit A